MQSYPGVHRDGRLMDRYWRVALSGNDCWTNGYWKSDPSKTDHPMDDHRMDDHRMSGLLSSEQLKSGHSMRGR